MDSAFCMKVQNKYWLVIETRVPFKCTSHVTIVVGNTLSLVWEREKKCLDADNQRIRE
jgi:hypothetical protein